MSAEPLPPPVVRLLACLVAQVMCLGGEPVFSEQVKLQQQVKQLR